MRERCHISRSEEVVMPARILATAAVTVALALVPAAGALATVSPTTGQPNQECPTPPNVSGFNSGGFAHAETVYAGSGKSADHANSTAAVSQYDVACTMTG
jgi:hypothetical protein